MRARWCLIQWVYGNTGVSKTGRSRNRSEMAQSGPIPVTRCFQKVNSGLWASLLHTPAGPAGGLKVAIGVTRIIVGVSERLAVIQEVLHRFNGNGEAKPLPKSNLHIRDAHHFAAHVKKRATAIARIDLGSRLEIELASHLPGLGAENAF